MIVRKQQVSALRAVSYLHQPGQVHGPGQAVGIDVLETELMLQVMFELTWRGGVDL